MKAISYIFFIINVLFCIAGARSHGMDNLFMATCEGVLVSSLTIYTYKKFLKERMKTK